MGLIGEELKMRKSEANVFKTKEMIVIYAIFFFVFASYFINFNDQVSKDTQVWGAFGSYIGGILSPIVAVFAFYLICKTYELQKDELEKTRQLLQQSTDAQEKNIKLAALTQFININLERISVLQVEYDRMFDILISGVNNTQIVHRLMFLEKYGGLGNISPDDPQFEKEIEESEQRAAECDSLLNELREIGEEFSMMFFRLRNIEIEISEYNMDIDRLKTKIINI
ncbi:hypothetical protein DDY07_02880 [Methylomonas sp. ZR1]|nr:hypothetical protein [Methylomonas sp. ZR1]